MWLEPNPYYGPKDQSQDIRGREMELKYVGHNLSRYDKLGWEKYKKETLAKLKEKKENSVQPPEKSQDKS
jgi:hypothetical protein